MQRCVHQNIKAIELGVETGDQRRRGGVDNLEDRRRFMQLAFRRHALVRAAGGPIVDEKPIKISVELPAAVWRDVTDYAQVLGKETGQASEPAKLVGPMLVRFMATDQQACFHHAR